MKRLLQVNFLFFGRRGVEGVRLTWVCREVREITNLIRAIYYKSDVWEERCPTRAYHKRQCLIRSTLETGPSVVSYCHYPLEESIIILSSFYPTTCRNFSLLTSKLSSSYLPTNSHVKNAFRHLRVYVFFRWQYVQRENIASALRNISTNKDIEAR